MSRILSLVAALVATVALLLSGAMPAEAATSDWRWKGRIVTVVDQVGGYNRDSIKQAVRELNLEQRALRFRYQTTSCKRGQKCATVSARTDGMSNWAAKAIPDQGRSCRIFTNAYWDGVGTRSIKTVSTQKRSAMRKLGATSDYSLIKAYNNINEMQNTVDYLKSRGGSLMITTCDGKLCAQIDPNYMNSSYETRDTKQPLMIVKEVR